MPKLSSWFKKKRFFAWLADNFLTVGIGFLLLFIPLYPKLPLIDVSQTWVYVRLEDFLVALIVGVWFARLALKKVRLKNPLFLPVLFYWLVGGISLAYAFLVIRSPAFSPHLGLLHFLRRIEYMILFFVAASTVKNLKVVRRYLLVIAIALFLVCLYGFGQKFLGWPAFLTMNEEFAKGIPLHLPPEARVTSTFAGHYDLAAWLVLMIALFGSLAFGLKKIYLKLASVVLVFLGFILLLFTASRVSFACYLAAISFMLFLQKKKILIIPVIVASFFLMNYITETSDRFAKTLRVQEVVYDARTGKPLGVLENPEDVGKVFTEEEEITQENLPLGSGFLQVPLIQRTPPKKAEVVAIKRPVAKTLKTAKLSSEIATVSGEFLIKRTIVYDVSFTTRFQGTWRRALQAFAQSPLLGTGYSSIELATDNSFLRALGETGILGLFAFLVVLFSLGLLAKRGLDKITNPFARSVLIGAIAGTYGMVLNGLLIDVFEASKVAFSLWILLGIVAGMIGFSVKKRRSLVKEMVEVFGWPLSSILLLGGLGVFVFYPGLKNYFSADDFTWLSWVAESKLTDIPDFFLSASGFFYRPLAKTYFWLAQPLFGLKPQGYHLVSFLLHFGVTTAAYFITLFVTRRRLIALLTGLFFLTHPVNAESVFWISSTSALLASFFYLWGFLAYILWRTSQGKWRRLGFLVLSILAFAVGLISHERIISFPLLLIFYDWLFNEAKERRTFLFKLVSYLPFWVLTGFYLWFRGSVAQAHGLAGDYNYNFKNLPFNFVGNLFGYAGELLASFHFIPFYDAARIFMASHRVMALLVLLGGFFLFYWFIKRIKENKILVFSLGFFLILLLPFLGLGNIAERHVYPAHLGFFITLSFLVVKLFDWIKKKSLSLGIVLLIFTTGLLSLFYCFELEKAREDWYDAGETANKILLALSTNYKSFTPGTVLYFADLPIRYNRAWIFPVGLKDGVWFIYKDESLEVKKLPDKKAAFELKKEKDVSFVFVFEEGELREVELERVELEQ